MATISGGLNQTSFLNAFASNPQLTSLTGGLIPTGTNISFQSLNPIQQLFSGITYDLYNSLGGTAIGGMSASNLATFQAFTQFYTLLFYQSFGPLIAAFGTTYSR